MATRYIRLDSTAGGDGTEDRTDGSTRAYAGMAEMITAEEGTLTEALEVFITVGGTDAAGGSVLNLVNFVTTASNYLLIEATGSAHHAGVSAENGGTGYQLARSGEVLRPNTPYVRLKGFEVTEEGDAGNGSLAMAGDMTTSSDQRYDEMIISSQVTTLDSSYAFRLSGTVTATVTNTLIITQGCRGFDARSGSGTCVIDHCGVISGNTFAIMCDGGVTATNTWAYSTNASPTEEWEDGQQASGSHNSSIQTTTGAAAGTSQVFITVGTDEFTNYTADPASADFTLKAASDLIAAGTGSEAVDITGSARTGTADIGPYNYAAAASGRVIGGVVGSGGLAGSGGIAGEGGGIAG